MLSNLLIGQTAEEKLYVEDVFSTYLFTSTGTTQTITNNIDLSTKGGMVWCKNRSASGNHVVSDTVRGSYSNLATNLTDAAVGNFKIGNFSASGFDVVNSGSWLTNGNNYASWTFRKAPKFFTICTWTGNGVAGRQISHDLGVAPGMIIVKSTASTGNWIVYHRSSPFMALLNTTDPFQYTQKFLAVSSTDFTTSPTNDGVGTTNQNGVSYVAYLFAHDTTADGVIQCGSFSVNAGNSYYANINLGWEPQYILVKKNGAEEWLVFDSMRGVLLNSTGNVLQPNTTNTETSNSGVRFVATGFQSDGYLFGDYIYLAIRRGPMRTPTDATKVFAPVIYTGNGGTQSVSVGFPVDMQHISTRLASTTDAAASNKNIVNRLTGFNTTSVQSGYTRAMWPNSTGAETDTSGCYNFLTTSFSVTSSAGRLNNSSENYISLNFRRAPGFFDITCYSGTGSARTVSHNLGVAPELMIVKRRDTTGDWQVYAGAAGEYLVLNSTAAKVTSNTDRWNNTAPTSSVFSLGTNAVVNASGGTYVAYLFATCAGVSKVGTYTGSGTTKQIDCGFTNGARFVLIKRTDSTGDWYMWDTARGVVAGNDPYLLLNSTAAEVTNTDYIDPYSAGFELSSTVPAALNANGGTFLYLAIA